METRFLEYACPDHHVRGRPAYRIARHAAMRMLHRHPELARHDFYTAVVCGEREEVERLLRERPELANAPRADIGSKSWPPLLYLFFTRLPLPRANEHAVDIARLLLDSGADPNAFFMAGDSRYTPLVGAMGEGEEGRPPHPRRDELARLLLERGADPYDRQVIYNLHFGGPILWYLELIHELTPKDHWADPEWRMLDMDRYGSGARWHLRIAVERDDLALAAWCLEHGADPNAAPERDERQPRGSLYEHALALGHLEMPELLARHGAQRTAPADGEGLYVAACLRLDRPEVQRLLAHHPHYRQSPKAMFAAAQRDRGDVVAFLLDLGVDLEIENERKERPLHVAAAHDAVRVAELLIRRGAEIDPVEQSWNNTPIDVAVYYEHARTTELLSRHTRDVGNLVFLGKSERLREVLRDRPDLAAEASLFWLPEDETVAVEIAELLLAHGADPARRDQHGRTAADVARRRGMHDVAALLDKRASRT